MAKFGLLSGLSLVAAEPELAHPSEPFHLNATTGGVNIVSGWSGKCLDLPGGDTKNGNLLWLWDCNGHSNQQWVFGSGTWVISPASDTSKCIDVLGWKGGSSGAGTRIGLWDCNGGNSQHFGYDSTKRSIYMANSAADASLCVDLSGGNKANGAQVEIWGCNAHGNQQWDIRGAAPGPSPGPSPGPAPSPPGHSDLQLQWSEGGGHGACNGPAVQGGNVIQTNGNDITITTDGAPAGSCVYRNAHPSIDLDQYPHIEVDLQTWGNRAVYGQHNGMWFSFWMYPPPYAYKSGIAESGEVDFVENINSVRTNFAGCRHDCHETSWGEQANSVSAHITMYYDRGSETVNVYRCAHGSNSCGTSGERAYIDLRKMKVNKPYTYTFSADVWYAKPGYNFKFAVSNLRVLRNAAFANLSAPVDESTIIV